ncbi:MAG: DUF559 domain-containing protein, partial [Anaerolineales bacterium]|nr:DUF559 domain-containing protein [Anaerolineales bacterium]
LNSVMLYYCVEAGLDMAIVNAAHVKPYAEIDTEERELCEDLIFNRREDALQRFIEHFENVTVSAESTVADPTAGMTPEQRLHWKILHRVKDGVEADIDEIINRSLTPNPSPVGEGDLPPSPLGGRAGDEGKPHKYNPRLPEELKARIRELRKESTEAEQLMWNILRNRAFHDVKFRRQHPMEGYILDFYCHEAKLCIELDGSQHNEDDAIHYDEERTKILQEKQGVKVVRFWNSDVLNKTEEVLNEIWNILDERLTPSPLTPLPLERGTDSLPPKGEGLGMRASTHEVAVDVLNNVLLPAMKEVGDKFGAGELILPFVLQSAETMKKTVSHLENYLEKVEGVTKGTVVIATVYGDVHDIGKNLVKTILANNGYTVIDLGKQVPAETIITKAVEVNATAIGLSALLVSTSKQMPLIVNELQRRQLSFPVLIGGAAINRRFGRRILQTEDGSSYEAGVFYCKDAFEGLETMDTLIDKVKRPELLARIRKESEMELNRASQNEQSAVSGQRSNIVPSPIALPAKLGQRIVKDMPLEMVLKHLNMNELYRLSWGAKNTHGAEWDKLKAEFDARLAKMTKEALKENWLKPQAVYGYFPCQADGNDLIVYNPESFDPSNPQPLTRFTFPRQPYGDYLALSDYYASVESGQMDVVALQVVTVGQEATEKFEKLQSANDYTEAYFVHGLAVQAAEATANYLHEHVRRELGLAENQGKRYSWGYPAIPELEDHFKVFKLLPAVESELGMSLSVSGQLIPEQSTAAIIVHHKDAKYYSVGESRVEQLTK